MEQSNRQSGAVMRSSVERQVADLKSLMQKCVQSQVQGKEAMSGKLSAMVDAQKRVRNLN